MLLLLTCGQRTPEWPRSQARVKYTVTMGTLPSRGDLNLSTVVIHRTEVYLEKKWSWDKNENYVNKVP